METIDPMFWGVLLRVTQMLVLASPYLLFGALMAGVLRAFVEPDTLKRAFSSGKGWLRLGAFAALLPWCSLSVLPVGRQLWRAGVNRRRLLVFLMAAPIFNPLTIAYAFSTIDLFPALLLIAGCIAVPMLASTVWNGLAGVQVRTTNDLVTPLPRKLSRRLALAGVTTVREICGPILRASRSDEGRCPPNSRIAAPACERMPPPCDGRF
jgi:uncharacterized membrane protein YraQ (UPF0718 family)